MFVNGQGICMGSGQVWLNDLNYMTDKDPELKIIALSGIVSKPESTPTPIVTPTPAPSPASNAKLPKVTKSPTDESVTAGSSCWFVAKYEDAIWAEWHFVSPDGKTDLAYDKINTQFPNLVVVEGFASTTRLKNIPKEMDGWKVYCRFSNNNGSVNTEMATIRIKEGPAEKDPIPTITKSPTSETVEAGGSCWFSAKHEHAILAEWFFVEPGWTDEASINEISYKDIGTKFPKLTVVDGNRGTMLLKNIPAEMDGWQVFCRFSNDSGAADTSWATIHIKGKSSPSSGVPTITRSPTSEDVDKGGSCWFVARADNATRVEWYFVAPDNTEVKYSDIGSTFPSLKVADGNTGALKLSNIPAEMNGWQVYCHFSNALGSADSNRAKITIKNASTDHYLGTYVCGRASIKISGGPQKYQVFISWGSSASEHSEWTFTGKFDENGILTYTDCTRTDVVYIDNVTHTDTVVYTNGTGKLQFSDPNLFWTDNKENKGDGMTFVKDYLA
jgi:hypothetical protein